MPAPAFLELVVVVLVSIAAHELAHALAARLVGMELFVVEIGGGPIGSFHLGSVEVRLGPIPIGGAVQVGSAQAAGFRRRAAVVAGAGPLANVVLAGVGAAIGSGPLVVFSAIAVVANAWPGRRPLLGEGASDGRVLLDLVRGDPDAVAEERSSWWTAHALRHREAGDLDGAAELVARGIDELGPTRSLLAVSGVVAFEQERFDDVVDAYSHLIDDDAVAIPARARFAADAAWAASLSHDQRWRSAAEPWAALARRVEPRDPRRRMVHGLALVDAGHPAAALAAVEGIDDAAAHAVAVLALSAAGERDAARERFERFVEGALDDAHPLYRRAAAVR